MPNFADAIKTLLDSAVNWIETDPAYTSLEFPEDVSRSGLTDPARIGKVMVWLGDERRTKLESEPGGGSLMRADIDIFCYSRASGITAALKNSAKDTAENMRGQVVDIVQANWNALSGAYFMLAAGGRDFDDKTVNPFYYVRVLTVEVYYEA